MDGWLAVGCQAGKTVIVIGAGIGGSGASVVRWLQWCSIRVNSWQWSVSVTASGSEISSKLWKSGGGDHLHFHLITSRISHIHIYAAYSAFEPQPLTHIYQLRSTEIIHRSSLYSIWFAARLECVKYIIYWSWLTADSCKCFATLAPHSEGWFAELICCGESWTRTTSCRSTPANQTKVYVR